LKLSERTPTYDTAAINAIGGSRGIGEHRMIAAAGGVAHVRHRHRFAGESEIANAGQSA